MRLIEKATRDMLNIIRENESKGGLIDVSEDDFNKAQEELRQRTKSTTATITSFKVYPENQNVIMVFKLPDLGDCTIQMVYSTSEGIFINASNIQLDVIGLSMINSLPEYYANFRTEWETKLKDEYRK